MKLVNGFILWNEAEWIMLADETMMQIPIYMTAMAPLAEACFYAAMVYREALWMAADNEKAVLQQKARDIRKKLEHWAKFCPDIFLCRYLLLEAHKYFFWETKLRACNSANNLCYQQNITDSSFTVEKLNIFNFSTVNDELN